MSCKKHLTDLSSNVGVCASCLRERLLTIMAAQASKHDCRKIDTHLLYQHHNQTIHQHHHNQTMHQHHHNQTIHQPHHLQQTPITFPRSVSPYISRRKSDYTDDTWHLGRRRFYSTPHVGPTGLVKIEIKEDTKRRGAGGGRISSMFWGLFRSRSEKLDFDSVPISEDPSSESPSWFASIIPGRRKKDPRGMATDRRRNRRNCDRGTSPARFWEDVEEDSHCNGGSSGYSSESLQGLKQTPRRTPASARRGGEGGGLSRAAASANYTSNLTFCLSPLVRASPNQRAQKDTAAPATEGRVSAAAFFSKNRSRKLADLGRYNNSNPTH